ncbi:MAG: glycosyltransferase [Pseudomonadota bacterium]
MTLDPNAHPAASEAIPVGQTDAGEAVLSNGRAGDAVISICVPTYHDGADALLASLVRLPGAGDCTLLIYDDGSSDTGLTRALAQQILRFPGPARLITASQNQGRSHARNRLIALAESDWILFLDADMRPDDEDFLNRYLEAAEASTYPSLIPGGFSLRHAVTTDQTRLHAAQSLASECLTASQRAEAPGRYVFTSNILVHREILDAVQFDLGFTGWGWEDVDWGLRIASEWPVLHIDNPATHLGLDTDKALLAKYGASGANFARALSQHRTILQKTPVFKAAKWLARLRLAGLAKFLGRIAASTRALPLRLRLFGLKLYRAAVYAEHV